MRARRPQHRVPGPVGDGGVQTAAAPAQWRPLQEDLRHLPGLQEYRFQNHQRIEALIDSRCNPHGEKKSHPQNPLVKKI